MVVLLAWIGRGSDTHQLLGGLDIGLGDVDLTALLVVLPTTARGGGRGEGSTGLPTRLEPSQLAGAGQLEPLAGAGVRLVLRHRSLFLIYVVWSRLRSTNELGFSTNELASSANPAGFPRPAGFAQASISG